MLKTTEAVRAVLGYATIDLEIRDGLVKVLEAHDNDLHDVGYDESNATNAAIRDLQAILNETDERAAAKKAELEEAVAEGHELDDLTT